MKKTLPNKKTVEAKKLMLVRTGVKAGARNPGRIGGRLG